MRIVGALRPVFLLLFIAAVLVLSSLLQSISRSILEFSPDPLFVFALFNIIIVVIIAGDYGPSFGEGDDVIPCLYHPYELEEDEATDGGDTKRNKYLNLDGYENGSDRLEDDDDESEDYGFDSDGGDEDDDDNNGIDDEISSGDMDEYNSNLRKRIEDFIDKVNKGWREERLRESLSNTLQLSYT